MKQALCQKFFFLASCWFQSLFLRPECYCRGRVGGDEGWLAVFWTNWSNMDSYTNILEDLVKKDCCNACRTL